MLSFERVDLAGILSHGVEDFREKQAAGGFPTSIRLRLVSPPPGRVWGRWDPGRLEQVLVNLIDNAFKPSPPNGEIVVALSVAGPETPGSAARAHPSVRDRGIGVPAEDRERIFMAFIRARNASGQHVPGRGLGLAIAREIVERHGGRLWVDSPEGEPGSIFHMLRPGVEDDA